MIKTKPLDTPGISEINGAKKISAAVKKRACVGIPFFESFVKGCNALSPCSFEREKRLRVVEKSAELSAEAAEVKTTKLITAAAHLKPIRSKTITNGDWSAGISVQW